MYSQQQQQQYASGHYGPASTTSTQQQQQQHVWNGQQWVLPTANAQQQQQSSANSQQSLVQTYTDLYHAYKQQAKHQQATPQQKTWAQYHADCAAWAAHYFHQHPGATTLPEGRVLPPNILSNSAVAASPNRTKNNTLQGYLQRCQAQLSDAPAAAHVQAVVQRELQTAAGNSLHTIDWASQPVPTTRSSSTQPSRGSQPTYVAPTFTATTHRSKKQKRETATAATASYYGPSSSSTSSSSHPILQAPRSNKTKRHKDKQGFNQSKSVLKNRAARFGTTSSSMPTSNTNVKYTGVHGGSNKVLDATDYERMTVKGTCTTLPKAYLRLTAPPRPELVRPLPILQRHLADLEEQLSRSKSERSIDYEWMCSQLKALRQDCTVQRIQNEFTVRVYVVHARTALLHHDLNEFNQCQTQLVSLFLHQCPGHPDESEFLAYRIVYHMVVQSPGHAVLQVLRDAMESQSHPAVQHALALRKAFAQQNMVHVWRLVRAPTTTETMHALLSPLLPTLRHQGLRLVLQAYTPTRVGLDVVRQYTGTAGDDDEMVRVWLRECGCVVEQSELVTKESKLVECGAGDAGNTSSKSLM